MAKETLSAHELNKYTYCPYQWYYEKKYGRAELRRMRKEYLEELVWKIPPRPILYEAKPSIESFTASIACDGFWGKLPFLLCWC